MANPRSHPVRKRQIPDPSVVLTVRTERAKRVVKQVGPYFVPIALPEDARLPERGVFLERVKRLDQRTLVYLGGFRGGW